MKNPRFTGAPPMRVWRSEDQGASGINWRVLVHPQNGRVYAANNAGVLEFDGVRWRLIPLPHGNPARNVLLAPDGRIWAGGRGELAVLEPNAHGELRAVDLTARLPEPLRPPAGADVADTGGDDDTAGGVNPIFIVTNASCVSTPEGLFFSFRPGFLHVRPDGKFIYLPKTSASISPPWWSDGAIHFTLRDGGAHRLDGERFVREPGLGDPRVFHASPHPAGGWLWLTAEGPIQVMDGVPRKFAAPDLAAVLADDRPRGAALLPDGRMVFATTNHGIVFADAHGQLLQIIDHERGLPANRVNAVTVDADGGLWLAMHVGIVRLQLDIPLTAHGAAQGLTGSPRKIARADQRLLLTHSEGFSWRDDRTGQFQSVPGFSSGGTHQAVAHGGQILVAGVGIFHVPATGPAVDIGNPKRLFHYALAVDLTRPDIVFAGSGARVTPWRQQSSPAEGAAPWQELAPFRNVPTGAAQLLSDGKGFLWVEGRDNRIYRVDLRSGLNPDAPVEIFGPAQGLPAMALSDHQTLVQVGDEVLLTSRQGVFRHDARRNRFEREPRLSGEAGQGPVASARGVAGGWLFFEAPAPRLVHLARSADGWQTTEHPVPALGGLIVNAIHADEVTRSIWLAGQGQLVAFDLDWRAGPARPPLAATVRRVTSPTGENLWAAPVYGPATADAALVLATERRTLRAEFAAPMFQGDLQGRGALHFRSRATGLEPDWSPWTTEAHRDFTNLPDGRTALEVQARGLDGRPGTIAKLNLDVLPPWWRTTPARVGWGALGLALVTGLVWSRTRALRRRNDHLESIVAARTAELERLRQIDRDESAAAHLAEEKARLEVLRYQLNPHFLFNALTSVCSQLPPALVGARATIERLTDFCQLTLFRPEDGEHPKLGDEIKLLRAYLDIEQTRWGDLLAVEIDAAPDVADIRIPSLLLLPLMENALKYGRATNRGGMTIRVAARRDAAGALTIEIANTGEWLAPGADPSVPSLGIGLENLRQRLARYYPGAHEFTTEAKDGWVIAKLKISDRRLTTESITPAAASDTRQSPI